METTIDYRIEGGVPLFRIWFDQTGFDEVSEDEFDQIMAGFDAHYLGYDELSSRFVVTRHYAEYTDLFFREQVVVIPRGEFDEVWELLYLAQVEWREMTASPITFNWIEEGF